jgi:hypothetical protein
MHENYLNEVRIPTGDIPYNSTKAILAKNLRCFFIENSQRGRAATKSKTNFLPLIYTDLR